MASLSNISSVRVDLLAINVGLLAIGHVQPGVRIFPTLKFADFRYLAIRRPISYQTSSKIRINIGQVFVTTCSHHLVDKVLLS